MKKLLSVLLTIVLLISVVPLGAFTFTVSAATYTEEEIQGLINSIDSIGEVEFSEECHSKIVQLENFYDDLSEAQKTLITNYDVLVDARIKYNAVAAEGIDTSEYTVYVKGEIDTVKWYVYTNGIIEFTGEGNIPGYTSTRVAPWYPYASDINTLLVRDTITEIGSGAFRDLQNIEVATLPFTGKSKTATGSGQKHIGYVFGFDTYDSGLRTCSTYTSGRFTRHTARYSYALCDYEGEVLCTRIISSYDYYDDTCPVCNSRGISSYRTSSTQAYNQRYCVGAPTAKGWYSAFDDAIFTYHYYVPISLVDINITNDSKISYAAFNGCANIMSIDISNSVLEIEKCAFSGCESLENILIPYSVTSIGDDAFFNCDKLTSVNIPDEVTSIGSNAFLDCSNLTSAIIPKSVTSIGADIFEDCYNLTDIWYEGSISDRANMTIDASNYVLLNATWHYKTCSNEHTYLADCDEDCNNCEWTRTPAEHTYDNVCDAVCNGCAETRDVPDHVYTDVCDTDCNICGFVREAPHTYDNACDAVCNGCSAPREVPDHVYDYACDKGCNICGDMRDVSCVYDNNCDTNCNICGAVREVPDHIYDNTCDTTCNECGAVRTITHTYDNDCDAQCNICGFARTPSDHVYDNACDAKCNECGETREVPDHVYYNNCDASCNVCGDIRTPLDHIYTNDCDTSCNECGDIRAITHTYTSDCDAQCNVCGYTRIPSDHVYDNDCDTDCNECGKTRTTTHKYDNACDAICNICGATRTPSGHVYSNDCDTTCNVCSAIRAVGDHIYDNACDASCNECGATRVTAGHIFTNSCDTTCNECGIVRTVAHKYDNACDRSCNICGYIRTASAHIYYNTCDTTCNECGAVRSITHTYDNACDSICNICYTERDVSDHVYYNACDTDCNVCGATRTISHTYGSWITTEEPTCVETGSKYKSCSICGDTVTQSIAATGSHSYESAVTKPTCTAQGYTTHTCSVCGANYKDSYVNKLGHSYENACDKTCNVCGATRTVPDHIYDNICDTTCNECGDTRATTHTYGNWITTKQPTCVEKGSKNKACSVCGDTITESIAATGVHSYHSNYDATCNECGAVRVVNAEWQITVSTTGIYALKPNSNYQGNFNVENIAVLDKNGKEVFYYEKLGGFPLVKGQNYTVKFRYDCADEITGTITWTKTKKVDTIFSDTLTVEKGGWYNDAVTYSVGAGLITGYGGTNLFGTADNIQRQDFVVILARLAGVDLTNYQSNRASFADVPSGAYYEKAILWAADCGITTGYNDGTNRFGVGDKITREQLVTFLYRYAKYTNGGAAPSVSADAEQKAQNYADYNGVTDYAQEAIIWALDKGVISGQGGTKIAPAGNALRCEIAQIMYNIFLNDIF